MRRSVAWRCRGLWHWPSLTLWLPLGSGILAAPLTVLVADADAHCACFSVQIHLDVGIVHDYAERRSDAMRAYAAAYAALRASHPDPTKDAEQHAAAGGPGGTSLYQARYLHGRAAKSMAYDSTAVTSHAGRLQLRLAPFSRPVALFHISLRTPLALRISYAGTGAIGMTTTPFCARPCAPRPSSPP